MSFHRFINLKIFLINFLSITAIFATRNLQAKDKEVFGLQIGVVKPTTDILTQADGLGQLKVGSNTNMGFSIGFYLGYKLKSSMIRGRMDYLKLPEYNGNEMLQGNNWTYTSNISNTLMGIDYVYFFKDDFKGPYLLGGLNWNWWREDEVAHGSLDGWIPAETNFNTTSDSGGIDIGVGFAFNSRHNIELKLNRSKIDYRSAKTDANTLQLSYLLRIGK